MENNLTKIKKLEKQLTAAIFLFFVLIVGFLVMYDSNSAKEASAVTAGNYNKNTGDSLTINDWKNLPVDFVNAEGDTMTGNLILNNKLGIGASSPNSQIHVYNASGNAEIDLQSVSGAGNHWGIYNERSNNSLNFWRGGSNRMTLTNDGAEVLRIFDTSGNSGSVQGKTYLGFSYFPAESNPAARIGVEEDGLASYNSSLVFQTRNSGGDTAPTTKMTINKDGNVGIGVANSDEKLHVAGNVKVDGNVIDESWKLLLEATEWTEESLTTITSSGVNFDTDHDYGGQRINFGKFSWPQYTPSKILLKITNRGDDFCAGGNGVGYITGAAGGVRAKCTDFQYQGTTLSKVNKVSDNWIQLYINNNLLLSCPDPVTNTIPNTAYPGRYGHNYWSVFCTYERGSDWNGNLNSLKVETADWSDDYSMWEWEIWVR